MPGTILVSVLEFLGLPVSSSSSTLSIKVSMGKKEYQIGDKGEFSFPLTTLRENLVVLVQDEDGNAISCAAVESKSIVERGVWDDIFSLEGGGQVHMKLQFMLSEDEKNRIRVLRESAVKKNRRELLGRRTSSASSLTVYNSGKNDENASTLSPLTRRAEVNTSKVNHGELSEQVQAQSLSIDIITKAIYPKKSSSSTSSFESVPSSMTQKDEVNANKVNPEESDEQVQARSLSKEAPTEAIDSKASSSSTSILELASSPKKRFSPLTQRTEVNTREVNPGESDEEVQAQSLSVGSPTKAAYSKVSSSSTSSSEPESSLKNRASPLIENAKVNTSKVNHDDSYEKVHAQSLYAEIPTKAAYSKVSSSSTSSSETKSSSEKRASPLTQRAEVNTTKVNPEEIDEKVQAQSLSAGILTEASYSKVSSSTSGSESESFLEKRASPLTQRAEVNTSRVNLTESVEKIQTRSIMFKTPTKAAYPKALSSSTSSSDLTSSSKKQASPFTQRAEVNRNKVNLGESDEKVQAQSLSAGSPTEAAYSKISSPSTSSSESETSSKKHSSLLTQKPEVNTNKVNLSETVEEAQAANPNSSTSSSESTPFSKKAFPLPERAEVNTTKVNYGESVKMVQPTKASFPKESSSSSKKRASLDRTPSSVKRMISAFENNLSPDFRPQAKPTPEKREPNKIGTELKPLAFVKFKELRTTKSREQELNLSPNSQLKLDKKEPDIVKDEPEKDRDKPSDDLTMNLKTEASSSAEKSSETTGISEEHSDDISVVDKEIQSENLSRSPRSSMHNQEDIHSSVEISGAWIFPDHHHRRFCVTTGGMKVTDFMEGQSVMSFSIPQKNRDEDDDENEIERSEETFEEEKSQPEIEDVESSRGIIQQVMKVTIMVGFGVLVLFTRQRNKR